MKDGDILDLTVAWLQQVVPSDLSAEAFITR